MRFGDFVVSCSILLGITSSSKIPLRWHWHVTKNAFSHYTASRILIYFLLQSCNSCILREQEDDDGQGRLALREEARFSIF